MRFGTFNFLQHPDAPARPEAYRRELEHQLEQMEYAEEMGFDSVWLAEHHFSEYGMMSDALLLAAHVAARTRRVRIGVSVSVLPFHNPIRIAEQVAAVDHLSHGRLDQGIGRGYQLYEFAGFGIDVGESRARFDECLQVMLKAWTQDRFSHQGRFFNIPEVSIYPKPLQKPHPPLFVAAVSDQTIVSTAKRGLPVLTGQVFMPFSQTLQKIQLYRDALGTAGFSPAVIDHLTEQSWFQRLVYVADTNKEAREEPREALMSYISILARIAPPPFAVKLPAAYADYRKGPEKRAQRTFEELWDEALVFGDPDRCAAKIRGIQAMGVDSLLCWMVFGGLEHHKVLRSMELFAREVMPQFRGAAAVSR